ncbi:circadian clock KaiB family protein [Pararhodospirillum oryzae]|uniref:KaiB protein n=1 Tax=Pararhodospirillum oryzae TaxID=478448 RepID=A0A512H7A7_9PROT|nr:circadian clock KaiB family protein [Pararhodospirillum oryzae]GEO81318.1 KaiB protein [Pararhodospirillum oryzae]
MTEPIRLTLYICGETIRSQNALRALDRIRITLGEACEARVVDVVLNPAEAELVRILATPTLIRDHPPPTRRVVGDLDDLEQVRRILNLPNQAS